MLPGRKYTPATILTLAWRRRWMILTPLVVCTMAGLIVSASLSDVYQSDMLIQVVPQRIPDSFVKPTVTMKTEDRIEAVTQQVKSRTQLEQMITEFGLYPRERQQLPMEDVVETMRNNIAVELVRGPSNEPAEAFHVRFTYNDAGIAMKVTQRLGTLYIDRNARDRGNLADATDAFLESKLGDARMQLAAQERKIQAFKDRHAGKLPSQADFNMQAIQSASSQAQLLAESIARDRDRKLMLERLYNDAQADPPPVVPAPAPAGAPADAAAATSATPQQQLDLARATLARARLRLKPEHPDIIRLNKTIAELEKKVADAAATATPAAPAPPPALTPTEVQRRERIQNMKAEIESLDRQIAFKEAEERRHREQVAEYQRRIEAVPGLEAEWIALSRDYDTLNQTYRSLLTKSQDAKVARDMEKDQIGEQFRVLDPARVPVRPIGPARMMLNGIAVGAGLALGLGLVVLLELRDSSFRNEVDVYEVLALPVLALVPHVYSEEYLRRARWRHRLATAGAVVLMGASGYLFWALKLWKHIV
jgi:polysaccharide chain length determinant protein (PEP-CTERM system associated)